MNLDETVSDIDVLVNSVTNAVITGCKEGDFSGLESRQED